MIRYWLREYVEIAENQGALILLIGAVVIYSFLYPVPYTQQIVRDVPTAVVDNDGSDLSRKFTRMLDANENIGVVSRPTDMETAQREFLGRQIYGIVVIPEHFERDVRRGRQTTVAAYYDTSTLLFYSPLKTGVVMVARTLGAGIQVRKAQAAGASFEKAKMSVDPLPFVPVPLYNPSGGYGPYAIPAVFILIIQQTVLIGMGIVSGARREILSRVPVRRARLLEVLQMVVGRAGAYVTVAVCTTLYSLAIMHVYYGFPLRCAPFDLLVLLTPYLLSVAFLGQALSVFFQSREIAVLGILFTSLPFVFLMGFAWPPEVIPSWLRTISLAIPSTSGVAAFLRLSQLAAPIQTMQSEFKMLWMLTGVYFLLACLATACIPVQTPAESKA